MLTIIVTRPPRATVWPARGVVRMTRPLRTVLLRRRIVRALPQWLAAIRARARRLVSPATLGTVQRVALA
jgi:hypothetical protein